MNNGNYAEIQSLIATILPHSQAEKIYEINVYTVHNYTNVL